MLRYEIAEDFTVLVWNDSLEQSSPFISQPHHPDGSPWEALNEATEWAEAVILHHTDPQANPFPMTKAL